MSARSSAPAVATPAAPERPRWLGVPRLRWPTLTLADVGVAATVVALLGIAIHIRTRVLSAPLWIDEGLSVGIARHALHSIPGVLRQDGSPPFYYLLLHFWIGLFGYRETSLHALSALFGLVAVPVAYWVPKATFGRRAGVMAAALVALNPFLNEYSDEGRMYTLVFLLALVATGAFLRAFVHGRRRYVPLFSGALAALLYTHNWSFFYAAAAGLALLPCLAVPGTRRRVLVDAVLAFGGAALLFAPWVPNLLYQTAHTGAPWSHAPVWRSLTRSLGRMLGGRAPETLLVVTALGGLGTLWAGSSVSPSAAPSAARRAAAALLVLALGTLVMGWEYSRVGTPAWALRYLVIVLAPLLVVGSAGLSRLRGLGWLAIAATGALFWWGIPHVTSLQNKSNVKAFSARIAPHLPRHTLVFSTQPEQVPVLNYYLRRHDLRYATPLGRVKDVGVMDWRDAMTRLRRARYGRRLAPLVRALAPGQELLFVRAVFHKADAPWTRTIRRLTREWGRALDAQPSLRRVRSLRAHRSGNRATVAMVLYRKVGR
jgi:mannosyltransferase